LAARELRRNRLDQINRSLELTSTAIHKTSFAEYAPGTNPERSKKSAKIFKGVRKER
jgi:hypothetical protein